MKNGRLQAKDLPDDAAIAAVLKCGRVRPAKWASRWDIEVELAKVGDVERTYYVRLP